jgi:hypothetical protein
MTDYSPKEFNDTTQYPTAYTETVDNLGTDRGRIKVITTAAGATATVGALDLIYDTIVFITGAASTATLAAGTDGQELTMAMDTDGGDMVVTVAALLGGDTITFDGTDNITLIYDGVNANWFSVGTPTAAITTA